MDNYDRMNREIRKEVLIQLNKILAFKSNYDFWSYEREFGKKFAKYCCNKFGIGTNSGTAALQFALISSGIKENDEVITVPNTFVASALAISNIGARPVFVDINPETYTIDISQIEEAMTENTKAIMPVHLFGQVCDMKSIGKIARKHGLKIVEDCAQAHGAAYKNKKVPTEGLGCFSFFTSKILGGLGNGGIIVTNDRKIRRSAEILRDPLANDSLLILSKRTPCYLDSVQIAFLNAKLPFLEKWIEKRRNNAKLYNEILEKTDIIIPVEEKKTKHCYHSYIIRTKKRDKLKRFLFKHRIETRIEYELPIHLTKSFQYLGYKEGNFPIVEQCNRDTLSLPINQFLKEYEITKVASLIKLFCNKNY